MRASAGAGPHAAITSSRAASQQQPETGTAETEDASGVRKTPCPMLRRFRISAGREAGESMGLLGLLHHDTVKRPSYRELSALRLVGCCVCVGSEPRALQKL